MQEAQAQAQRGGEILASALATGCLDAASQLSSWLPTSSREDTSSAVLGCVMSCIRSLRESGELHTRCSEYTHGDETAFRALTLACVWRAQAQVPPPARERYPGLCQGVGRRPSGQKHPSPPDGPEIVRC